MKRQSILVLAAIFALGIFGVVPEKAVALVTFDDGQIHNINYQINDDVWVDYQSPGMQTTVNLLEGGSIHYDYPYGAAGHALKGYEDSIINMSGGSIYQLLTYGSSQVTVSGGSIIYLMAADNSQVAISGGTVSFGGRGSLLTARDNSQVVISGGTIGGCLHAFGSSQVSILGGLFGRTLEPGDNAVLTIDGSDFAVDGTPVGYIKLTIILGGSWWDEPYRRLTGTLLSGEPLNNDFRIGEFGKIVLVPEPATLLLLGFGGMGLVRRRRHS